MRFYGFDVAEIVDDSAMLPLDIDPKLAWALRHRDRFPLDVNRASREELLRVPGFGTKPSNASSQRGAPPPFAWPIWRGCTCPQQGAAVHRAQRSPARPHRLDEARLIERFKPKATQLGFGF